MHSRILKASLAGAGALALLGAGTTYAAFTGSTAVAGSAAAGTFKVAVSPGDASFGSSTGLLPGAPGTSKDFLVSNAGTVPASTVTIELADRQDSENSCASDSEKALDPECGQTGDRGDLSNQARVTATQYAPLSGACGDAAYAVSKQAPFTLVAPAPPAGATGFQPARTTLAALDDTNTVGTLPFTGTATCVRVTLTLPDLPDNDAVQGDTVFFKVRLGLVQATTGVPAAVSNASNA